MNEIETAIAACMLPKLEVNFDEKEIHPEIITHNSNLSDKLKWLVTILKEKYADKNFTKAENEKIFCLLLILYDSLKSKNILQDNEKPELTNTYLEHDIKGHLIILDEIVKSNPIIGHQEVFDKCIEILHEKLTPENWKRYPSLVDAYCAIVSKVQVPNIALDPVKVLPAALLLMWDHNKHYILKGLSCCLNVLHHVNDKNFGDSNYQEAVYQILKKLILDKETRIILPSFKCIQQLINVYPVALKEAKVGEIMRIVLDEAIMESNLERKSTMAKFLNILIGMYGTDSIRWKRKISSVILENLTLCTMDNIPVILIENTLELLQQWLKHSWCVWNYEDDKQILACLLKLLCIAKQKNELDHLKSKIFDLIISTIDLCSAKDKATIRRNLNESMCYIEKSNLKDLCCKLKY